MIKAQRDTLFAPIFRKLDRNGGLSSSDQEALASLDVRLRNGPAGSYLFREGDRPTYCWAILSGFVCRQKLTRSGFRQITSLHMAGDIVDLEQLWLPNDDHNVQALTNTSFGAISIDALKKILNERPTLAAHLWRDSLIDASISREWIVNIGRRNAQTRIAHLLCEFGARSEIAGITSSSRFEFPLTQEQIADVTGMTSVHVNRTLHLLSIDGLIQRAGRKLIVPDWRRLAHVTEFRSGYLHSVTPTRAAISS